MLSQHSLLGRAFWLLRALVALVRLVSRLLGLAWRLRAEIILLVTLWLAWAWLSSHLPTWGVWTVLLAGPAVLFAIPVSRRFVVRRGWCVITRHRLRSCLIHSGVMTHAGRLPWFIWTRPTPVGERVRLWLRPGLCARDLETAAERIATACWAADARVAANPDRVSTVWIDVIRRDPLSGDDQITSPLLAGVEDNTESGGELIPLPDRTTLHPAPPAHDGHRDTARAAAAPIPIPSASATKAKATTTRTARTAEPPDDTPVRPAALGRSGEDVSDYV